MEFQIWPLQVNDISWKLNHIHIFIQFVTKFLESYSIPNDFDLNDSEWKKLLEDIVYRYYNSTMCIFFCSVKKNYEFYILSAKDP